MPVRLENRDRVMVGAISKIRTLGKSQVPSRQKIGLGSVGETGANEGKLSGAGGGVRGQSPDWPGVFRRSKKRSASVQIESYAEV